MVAWECPTNPREASGLDPEAVHGAYLLLSGDDSEQSSIPVEKPGSEPADPVERLKQRYAEGDLSERELERRLERELDGGDDPIDRELARERD